MFLQHVSRHSNHNQVNYWTRTDNVTYRLCGPNRYHLLHTNSLHSITVSASHCMLQTPALVFVYSLHGKFLMQQFTWWLAYSQQATCTLVAVEKNKTALNVSVFICRETEKQMKQLVLRGVVRFVRPTTLHVFTHHFAEVHYFICAYTPLNHNMSKKLQNSRSMGLKLSTQTGVLARYVKRQSMQL